MPNFQKPPELPLCCFVIPSKSRNHLQISSWWSAIDRFIIGVPGRALFINIYVCQLNIVNCPPPTQQQPSSVPQTCNIESLLHSMQTTYIHHSQHHSSLKSNAVQYLQVCNMYNVHRFASCTFTVWHAAVFWTSLEQMLHYVQSTVTAVLHTVQLCSFPKPVNVQMSWNYQLNMHLHSTARSTLQCLTNCVWT